MFSVGRKTRSQASVNRMACTERDVNRLMVQGGVDGDTRAKNGCRRFQAYAVTNPQRILING